MSRCGEASERQPTAPKEARMTTNLKLKLVGLATTVAMFVLPVADAAAHALTRIK